MAEAGLSNLGSGKAIVWVILLIVFGFLAICLPFVTSWGVVVVVAWLIVFSGAFQFIHAFQSHGVGHILWKLLVANPVSGRRDLLPAASHFGDCSLHLLGGDLLCGRGNFRPGG